MAKDLRVSFAEPMQVVGVLYLAALNAQKITTPAKDQAALGRSAAYGLLSYLPVCFTAENRPATISEADWAKGTQRSGDFGTADTEALRVAELPESQL